MFYENALKKADINIATSGDNTIISAPTAGYIAIDHINFIPTSAVTVQMIGGTTNYGGAYALDEKQAFTIENAIQNSHGIITLLPGEAFKLNLSGAVQVSGFIRYRIVI
jgi:predicted metallo-beta-lactamase superfamily hydrolase